MKYFGGIDAGSTYLKMAVVNGENDLAGYHVVPTGIDCRSTARNEFDELMKRLGVSPDDMGAVISTGYGRRRIDIADENVTEIKAHAAGTLWTANGEKGIRTLIDIGGQDSKVIMINEWGETENFAMNDKCAAGTGRFLEVLARVLDMEVVELGPSSLQAEKPCRINSLCAVFAESEVISLLARGEDRKNIIAGIHASLAKRISSMAKRAGLTSRVMLTGGGALNPGLVAAFEDELMMDIYVARNPQLNGAIGAALLGKNGNGSSG
jgi:(R)-2-hydroxyacyl-CoA dehydratese activating ATPase